MEQNLVNRLQEIKEHEQAIKEKKDFIRSSFIAAIKGTTHPSVKKIGSVLHIISYKDMYNWDVRGEILENFLKEKEAIGEKVELNLGLNKSKLPKPAINVPISKWKIENDISSIHQLSDVSHR